MKGACNQGMMNLMMVLLQLILFFGGIACLYFGYVILISEGPVNICTSTRYSAASTCSEQDGLMKHIYGILVIVGGVMMLGILFKAYLAYFREKLK